MSASHSMVLGLTLERVSDGKQLWIPLQAINTWDKFVFVAKKVFCETRRPKVLSSPQRTHIPPEVWSYCLRDKNLLYVSFENWEMPTKLNIKVYGYDDLNSYTLATLSSTAPVDAMRKFAPERPGRTIAANLGSQALAWFFHRGKWVPVGLDFTFGEILDDKGIDPMADELKFRYLTGGIADELKHKCLIGGMLITTGK